MAKKIHNFKDVNVDSGNMRLSLDMTRINRNLNDAQFALDSAVMTSMIPYMPMQSGQFINVTKAMSESIAGSGEVVAAAPPMGRFLYEGKVMVGERTRSAWAEKGERKEVINKKLEYFDKRNPKVQSHWFEAAKEKDSRKWKRIVDTEMSKP